MVIISKKNNHNRLKLKFVVLNIQWQDAIKIQARYKEHKVKLTKPKKIFIFLSIISALHVFWHFFR